MSDEQHNQNEQTPAPAAQPAADFTIGNRAESQPPAPDGPQGFAAELLATKSSWYWKTPTNAEEQLLHGEAVAIVAADVERRGAAEAEAKGEEPLANTTRMANRNLSLPDRTMMNNPQRIDSDVELGHFLAYADVQNIPTPTVNSMLEAFADMVATGAFASEASLQAALDHAEHAFAGRLRPDQSKKLRRWVTEELVPAMRRERASRAR